jgi:hypothetical protein
MPSHWQRATRDLACGAVRDCAIRSGAAYCVLSSGKLRCEAHAQQLGLSAPADLDARPQVREALSFTGLKALAETVPVDWARKAANDSD